MRILVVGSGGREHALAWKLAQSARVDKLYAAPGNGGTAEIAQNVPIEGTDVAALLSFAQRERIDLTVVGPEAPLVAGLVDAFADAGLRAFGPTAAAAQLEGSKAFAKRFMIEEGIPTAVGAVLTDYDAALRYLRGQGAPVRSSDLSRSQGAPVRSSDLSRSQGAPVRSSDLSRSQGAPVRSSDLSRSQGTPIVVKASGLAAGKGVFVCATLAQAEDALRQIMVERAFGPAGDEVLIETCLQGEEASLLAFSDGWTVVPMLPARDYKRAGDGDTGPNTGGMGGYAPSPYLPPALVDEVVARILRPAVDGMRRRGTPYAGVLYAGLMLTGDGPRVLEFNCRFGDPEAQVLLPLLDSDLVELLVACVEGRLGQVAVRWKAAHAVTVVMASGGYPGPYQKGKPIAGVQAILDRTAGALPGTVVFHAGTRQEGDQLLTCGGRVLAVTSTAPTPAAARAQAYAAVQCIRFDGAQYRQDIAGRAAHTANPSPPPFSLSPFSPPKPAYAAAGVDIAAKSDTFRRMRDAVESTYTPAVLAGIGAFGGLIALDDLLQEARDPVLVASTDGVGTKTLIAAALGRYEGVGYDIVNHCVNDILVQGARPLFFLDYIASGRLDPDVVVQVVSSCAAACRASRCVLIGGETAEMPGVYHPGSFDLVGTMVGWVERAAIVDGRDVRPGDVCLGLPSTGLHTNGYSLARQAFAGVGWETVLPGLGRPLGKVLLEPHKSYLSEFEALVRAGVTVKAMAHITGGGFSDNLPRVLPAGVGVRIDRSAWDVPPIFRLIQQRGRVDELEMYQVFNMGVGMVVIVCSDDVHRALTALDGHAYVIGETVAWEGSGPRVSL